MTKLARGIGSAKGGPLGRRSRSVGGVTPLQYSRYGGYYDDLHYPYRSNNYYSTWDSNGNRLYRDQRNWAYTGYDGLSRWRNYDGYAGYGYGYDRMYPYRSNGYLSPYNSYGSIAQYNHDGYGRYYNRYNSYYPYNGYYGSGYGNRYYNYPYYSTTTIILCLFVGTSLVR